MSIVKVTDDNFAEVVESGATVLVDFYADSCGPCRALAPVMDQIAEEYEGKVVVAKVDVADKNTAQSAQRFGITGIPSVFLFQGGEVVDKVVGGLPKKTFTDLLDKHLEG